MLISSQMLPKSIASCSFSGMILIPHYYFQGQKGPIYWGFFSRLERSNLDFYWIYLFIINVFGKYFALVIVLMNCEEKDFIETLKVIFKVRFG